MCVLPLFALPFSCNVQCATQNLHLPISFVFFLLLLLSIIICHFNLFHKNINYEIKIEINTRFFHLFIIIVPSICGSSRIEYVKCFFVFIWKDLCGFTTFNVIQMWSCTPIRTYTHFYSRSHSPRISILQICNATAKTARNAKTKQKMKMKWSKKKKKKMKQKREVVFFFARNSNLCSMNSLEALRRRERYTKKETLKHPQAAQKHFINISINIIIVVVVFVMICLTFDLYVFSNVHIFNVFKK